MMKRTKQNPFKIGEWITVRQIPPGLKDTPGLETKTVFERALGKTFCIKALDDEHGLLELLVAKKRSPNGVWDLDTIWIEPEFVVPARKPRRKK
jgi:hypothetical protein